jgi:ABC-type multidrug transport system ATPase subunit
MIIEVNNLTKAFDKFVAVNDVSFDVNEGETFALLGPNGSGKTTTLKCLVGLALPTSGKMTIGGLDVSKNGRAARALASYLPQRVSFHESLTAREVMEFYQRLRKVPAGRVDEILNLSSFHFNGFANRPVSELSGGMIQRLGLAVACLPDAPVLVLDEPTISLDPEGAIQFREFLGGLKRAGKTIVLSSHMLADAEQLADRVGILVGGKLVALESAEALRKGLTLTSRMLVVLLNPDQRWAEAARRAGAEDAVLEGDSLKIIALPEDRLQILRAIENAGARVARFATSEQSLEDIYLKYIRREQADDRAKV